MKIADIVVVLALSISSLAQSATNLKTEMAKLNVDTALVIPSSAVDEYPLWSPDTRYLAVNIEGKWFKVDLSKLRLQEAKWLGRRIGAVTTRPELEPVSSQEISQWTSQNKHGDSDVIGNSGLKAEIHRTELSSSLMVRRGSDTKIIWKTEMENCGSLSFSANEKYLAYICETNGVLVMDLSQNVKSLDKEN